MLIKAIATFSPSQLPQPDDVSADYKTQVSSLLEGDPVDMLGNPPYAAEYFHNYY